MIRYLFQRRQEAIFLINGVSTMSRVQVLCLAVLMFSATGVFGTTLDRDSIVCDDFEDLALLEKPNLKGQPADVVFKRVNATVKFYALFEQVTDIKLKTNAEEERINSQYNSPGSTAARNAEDIDESRKNEGEKIKHQAFLKNCAVSGAEQTVTIVERKPIAGLAKIHARVNNLDADVWTRAEYLKGD